AVLSRRLQGSSASRCSKPAAASAVSSSIVFEPLPVIVRACLSRPNRAHSPDKVLSPGWGTVLPCPAGPTYPPSRGYFDDRLQPHASAQRAPQVERPLRRSRMANPKL